MPWYEGATLLHHLENVNIAGDRNLIDLRFPVQYVLRPNLDFRGFAGTVASGVVRPGDEVMVPALPAHLARHGDRTFDGDVGRPSPPMAVTLTLATRSTFAAATCWCTANNLPPSAATSRPCWCG